MISFGDTVTVGPFPAEVACYLDMKPQSFYNEREMELFLPKFHKGYVYYMNNIGARCTTEDYPEQYAPCIAFKVNGQIYRGDIGIERFMEAFSYNG